MRVWFLTLRFTSFSKIILNMSKTKNDRLSFNYFLYQSIAKYQHFSLKRNHFHLNRPLFLLKFSLWTSKKDILSFEYLCKNRFFWDCFHGISSLNLLLFVLIFGLSSSSILFSYNFETNFDFEIGIFLLDDWGNTQTSSTFLFDGMIKQGWILFYRWTQSFNHENNGFSKSFILHFVISLLNSS